MEGAIGKILFEEQTQINEMAKYVSNIAFIFVTPAFFIALMAEYFRNWEFKKVVVRLIICLIAMTFFPKIHYNLTQISFESSDTIIKKYSPRNHFLKNWMMATKFESSNESKSTYDYFLKSVKGFMSDFLAFLIWSLSVLIFIVLKQIYSFIFYLTYLFYPVCGVLSLFPISINSLNGAIKSSLWCFLMPLVLSFMLILMDGMMNKTMNDSGVLIDSFEGMISLAVVALMFLGSTVLTQKLINGTGLSSFAENMNQYVLFNPILNSKNIANKGKVMVKAKAGDLLRKNIHLSKIVKPQSKNFINKGKKWT